MITTRATDGANKYIYKCTFVYFQLVGFITVSLVGVATLFGFEVTATKETEESIFNLILNHLPPPLLLLLQRLLGPPHLLLLLLSPPLLRGNQRKKNFTMQRRLLQIREDVVLVPIFTDISVLIVVIFIRSVGVTASCWRIF